MDLDGKKAITIQSEFPIFIILSSYHLGTMNICTTFHENLFTIAEIYFKAQCRFRKICHLTLLI